MPEIVGRSVASLEHSTVHTQLQLSLFHVERASYRSLRLLQHSHPHWAISFVVSGEVETSSRGERFLASAGDVMIHPPRITYSEVAETPGTHEWFLVEALAPPGIDLFRLHPVAPVIRLQAPGEFSTHFESLRLAWHEEKMAYRDIHVFALTTRLLAQILQSWQIAGSVPRPSGLQSSEDRFVPVLNYISDHFGEKLSRDILAERVCLHPVYFDRLFRETFGVPPMRMLRDLRLQRARQMLESTDATLEVIAETCGFGLASYLNRVFQKQFGQTPGDYRQGLKNALKSYTGSLS